MSGKAMRTREAVQGTTKSPSPLPHRLQFYPRLYPRQPQRTKLRLPHGRQFWPRRGEQPRAHWRRTSPLRRLRSISLRMVLLHKTIREKEAPRTIPFWKVGKRWRSRQRGLSTFDRDLPACCFEACIVDCREDCKGSSLKGLLSLLRTLNFHT